MTGLMRDVTVGFRGVVIRGAPASQAVGLWSIWSCVDTEEVLSA